MNKDEITEPGNYIVEHVTRHDRYELREIKVVRLRDGLYYKLVDSSIYYPIYSNLSGHRGWNIIQKL